MTTTTTYDDDLRRATTTTTMTMMNNAETKLQKLFKQLVWHSFRNYSMVLSQIFKYIKSNVFCLVLA